MKSSPSPDGRSPASIITRNVLGLYPRGWRLPLEYRREQTRKDTLVRLMGVCAAGRWTIPMCCPRTRAVLSPKDPLLPKAAAVAGSQVF